MPEFAILTRAQVDGGDGSPQGCSLCADTRGPFVLVGQATFTAADETGGIRPITTTLQFCAPILENGAMIRQGCAGQIATIVGYTDPETTDDLERRNRYLADATTDLRESLTAAEANQLRVVPVDELIEALNADR